MATKMTREQSLAAIRIGVPPGTPYAELEDAAILVSHDGLDLVIDRWGGITSILAQRRADHQRGWIER